MHKIKLTIPCQYDNNGYTYKPYVFAYRVLPEFEQNDKLISLIFDEIKRLSWLKLQEWKQSGYSNIGISVYLMPETYVENIGQIATDNILKKCRTINDVYILYEQEEEQKRIKDANTCKYCGLQFEKCSLDCARHN